MNTFSKSNQDATRLYPCVAAVVLTLLIPATCPAQETVPSPAEPAPAWTANIGLSSDYLFRGISQTEGPAVSGGFDFASSASGFYLGVWSSNVDFGDEANIEIDYYGGVSGDFSQGTSWDIGAIYYDYPGEDINDYIEAYGTLSHALAGSLAPEISVFLAWSPDFFAETGRSIYVHPELEISTGNGFGASLGYGYQYVEALGDYSHASIGLSKQFDPYTISLDYNSNHGVRDFCGSVDVCDDTLVLNVSGAF